MAEGRLLDRGEIDELARTCRLPLAILVREPSDPPYGSSALRRLNNLERVRMDAKAAPAQIDPSTAAIRIHYIRDYLKWLTSPMLLICCTRSNIKSCFFCIFVRRHQRGHY
jgi:hypothetical protein